MSYKLKRSLIYLVILSIVIILISGSASYIRPAKNSDKLQVTVTTTFLTDLVKQLGKDKVEVQGLMGVGVDPHQYQASSSDLVKLSDADLIVYGGLHLESKLGDVLEKLAQRGKTVLNGSKDIPVNQLLLTSGSEDKSGAKEATYDPHIWFDVTLWRTVSYTVKEELIQVDAVNQVYYEQNYQDYMQQLDELETYISKLLQQVPQESKVLVTAHDAFNYFARYSGIEVHGIQGVNTTVEAGTRDISTLANLIATRKIKAIFVESSVSPKLIQSLQESVQAKGFQTAIGGSLFSDSTGDQGSLEQTYIGMYRHNIQTIVEALN